MRIFLNKKAKRGQIFPMRAGDAKQKINLPWPYFVVFVFVIYSHVTLTRTVGVFLTV